MKIEPDFENKKELTLKVWFYNFLKRKNFVLRTTSHIKQTLPSDYNNQSSLFLKDVFNKRRVLGIDSNILNLIINIDEILLIF